MVFLWSDILVFILTATVAAWFYFAVRQEYWRIAMRKVYANKMACICFGIILVYALIAFIDCVHFRSSDAGKGRHIISLLDHICWPLISHTERTYSAPFSLHSYSKETLIGDNGAQYRDFPKLTYAGAHLGRSGAKWPDIAWRTARGAGIGIGISCVILCCFLIFLYLQKADEEKRMRLKARGIRIIVFASCVIVLAGIIAALAGGYHVLGTDKTGVDVLYISLKGARTGLIIGTLTTLIVTPFAIFFGVLAGYFGGRTDDLIQYVYTTLASIPDILLIAAAMLIFQVGLSQDETVISADKRLVYLCVIMGITSWTGLCRLIRAEVLKLREVEFIQAAQALGVPQWKIILNHLVPNIMHIVLISVVLRFSGLVLAEAVLAYVGIGVDPSMHSWGNMINQARLELARDPVVWWNLFASFVFMLGVVLPANIFGDSVRDALDPRMGRG